MRFFVDTADVDQIRKANDMGVICGVTTNPSLIAKSGRQFEDVIKEITSIVDGAISGEVKATTTDAEGMIKEGREIAKIHPNMVVKIPTRLDDISQNGLDLIADIREIFDAAGDIDTQIICASVRNPIHVTECAKMGADIATVPYNVFEQMMKHPLTDQGIAKFQADYKAVFGE